MRAAVLVLIFVAMMQSSVFGNDCPPLQSVTHGSHRFVTYEGWPKQICHALYQCEPGYTMVGRKSIYCIGGKWSGPPPSCQGLTCTPLQAPGNGSMRVVGESPVNMLDSITEFDCDQGFQLEGVDAVICLPDGSWSHPAPTCVPVTPCIDDEQGTIDEQGSGSGSSDPSRETFTIRLSLRELDLEGNGQKKNDFLKAWKMIKDLHPSDPNSFYAIASYHGMPYKNATGGNIAALPEKLSSTEKDRFWWNGYCHHGDVLFPTWHRFYLLRLEKALQSAVPDTALHYWDTASEINIQEGIPPILTDAKVVIDGKEVDNPLLSFKLPEEIPFVNVTHADNEQNYFVKPKNYVTKRFPYSGLEGNETMSNRSKTYNNLFTNKQAKSLLELNVAAWINTDVLNKPFINPGIRKEMHDCLMTKNYNAFSNTVSAAQYHNHGHAGWISLEQPHNHVHLAVGGQPHEGLQNKSNPIKWFANGDMGENESASFDPVFFLHHANIDRLFWLWQQKHHATEELHIKTKIAGTDETDHGTLPVFQNTTGLPLPFVDPDKPLSMDTPLYPFYDDYNTLQTSRDCVNIEHQLHYNYSKGSHSDLVHEKSVRPMQTLFETVGSVGEMNSDFKGRSPGLQSSDVAYQVIYDITDVSGETVVEENEELQHQGWKKSYILQVSNINVDQHPGSHTVVVFRHASDGSRQVIAHGGILDRWEVMNMDRHRALVFNWDSLDPDHPSSLDEVTIELRYKNENADGQEIVNIDVRNNDAGKPKVKFYVSFEQVYD